MNKLMLLALFCIKIEVMREVKKWLKNLKLKFLENCSKFLFRLLLVVKSLQEGRSKPHLARLSTGGAVGGLFCCPLFEQRRPDLPLVGFGQLEEICAHVSVLLSPLSGDWLASGGCRGACCGYMVPRRNKGVKRGTTQSTFCTKSVEPCCAKRTWNHADKSCII